MNFSSMAHKGLNYVKTNSPELLTGMAIVGLGATAFLSHRAAKKAEVRAPKDRPESDIQAAKEYLAATWDVYIPPVLAGIATTACIIGANKTGNNRTAAAVAAYSLTERAFQEYKSHVVDQIGEKKEKAIRDKIAADRVAKTYDPSKAPILVGDGKVLCCELYTQRYFESDMQTLRSAVNDVNFEMSSGIRPNVGLDDFYDMVGLDYTQNSGKMGWDADRPLRLDFSSTLTNDGRPCLAFEYNYVQPIWN